MSSVDISSVLYDSAGAMEASHPRRMLRFALYSGELYRLPRGMRNVQILSGTAWISVQREDVLAKRGSKVQLALSAIPALISGLGREPLLFEVW